LTTIQGPANDNNLFVFFFGLPILLILHLLPPVAQQWHPAPQVGDDEEEDVGEASSSFEPPPAGTTTTTAAPTTTCKNYFVPTATATLL
jgi:hypothetical protein